MYDFGTLNIHLLFQNVIKSIMKWTFKGALV